MELAEDRKLNISNIQIIKRTFEGINDSPITSKYYPSKKYAVSYDIKGYEYNPSIQCVTTKKDAGYYIEQLQLWHNIAQ
jgi:hypothetical protein